MLLWGEIIEKNITRIANAVQVILWVSVTNSQCHDDSISIWEEQSLNHKSLPMSLSLSVSLSSSERSHVSTTVLQCFEDAKIRRWLTESLIDNVTNWAVLESWKQVTSVFSGLVVFSILGFMAHTNGLTVQVSLIFFLFVLLLHFSSGTYFVVHKALLYLLL